MAFIWQTEQPIQVKATLIQLDAPTWVCVCAALQGGLGGFAFSSLYVMRWCFMLI
jgi:hypothetical protein